MATLGPEFDEFRRALDDAAPTSIRVNLLKYADVIECEGVPWCAMGFYLKERPVFTLDPNFHAGAYYVQEASSMFVEEMVKKSVDLRKPVRVLDLCAAPGGKSTHLLDVIGSDSLLVSNEVIKSRAAVLSENIQKWGRANAVVTNNDPKDFGNLTGFFDVILVDAPCSGEGLFRKDESAVNEWSEENANLCSLRQRRILGDVWPALKQNGVLIYCTCTYNEAENEGNLAWLAEQKDIEFLELPYIQPGIERVAKGVVRGYRFKPHRVAGEGFFISAIRKRSVEREMRRKRIAPLKKSRNDPGWLWGELDFMEINDMLIAVPSALGEDIAWLSELNIVTRGVAVATIARNKLVPEHALALSVNLNRDEFPVIEMEKGDALRYLSRESVEPVDGQKGFAVIRYAGNNLGFVNRLGNRVNNMYPANWRIRMKIP